MADPPWSTRGGAAFDRLRVDEAAGASALVERVRAIAQRKGVTAAQLALAWVLAKGEDLVPIPGTKRRKYLEEDAAAADIKLTPQEVAELEAAIPLNDIVGERYNPAAMRAIDRS